MLIVHSLWVIGEAEDLLELVVSGLYTVGSTRLYVNEGQAKSFFPVRSVLPNSPCLGSLSIER